MKKKKCLIEVSIRKDGELVNTVIGRMSLLVLDPHHPKWTSSLGALIIGANRVLPTVTIHHCRY